MIWGVEKPIPSCPGLGCNLRLKLPTRWRPTMTESFPPPLAVIGSGGPWRPDGSPICWPQAFRAQRSQPDTFRGRLSLLAAVRRGGAPAGSSLASRPPTGFCLCLTRWAAAGPCCFGAPSRPLLIAPRGHRDRLLDDRSRPVSRSLAERLAVRAWPLSRCRGDRWHGRGQSRSLSCLWGGTMAIWSGPAPLEWSAGRITHLGAWLRAAGQGGQTRCWWPAANAAVPRRWALGQRLGLPMARPCQALRSGGGGLLGPGEPGCACWRAFPLVQAGAAPQGPAKSLWPRQPPPG